jgi:hypothetical protein
VEIRANRISTEVLAYIDVEQLANETVDALAAQGLRPQLVDRLRELTGPLADGVADRVRGRVEQLVASPRFTASWNRALQVTHQQATTVLSGEAAAISIEGDMVVLDLGPFIDAAKQQLIDSGFTAAARIPQVHPTVDLFAASTLVRAQTAYRMLDAVATWLPWITLLILAAGVYLARHRRRAVLGIGLGVVAGMLVLAAALMVGRALLVGAVPEQGAAAAAASYDILVPFLRDELRTLAVLGLVVALGAFLAGPSTTAGSDPHGARSSGQGYASGPGRRGAARRTGRTVGPCPSRPAAGRRGRAGRARVHSPGSAHRPRRPAPGPRARSRARGDRVPRPVTRATSVDRDDHGWNAHLAPAACWSAGGGRENG